MRNLIDIRDLSTVEIDELIEVETEPIEFEIAERKEEYIR